jgi:hypothetical protein
LTVSPLARDSRLLAIPPRKTKRAAKGARWLDETGPEGLLLVLGELGLEGGIATLVVSEAAFLFDVLVGLLTHGEMN